MNGLIVGVSNERSLGWSVARAAFKRSRGALTLGCVSRDVARVQRLCDTHLESRAQALEFDLASQAPIAYDGPDLDFVVFASAKGHPKGIRKPLLKSSFEEYCACHQVTSFGLITTLKAVESRMSKECSVVAVTYNPLRTIKQYAHMAHAKASLESIVKSLAVEIAPKRVNLVSPGPFRSVSAKGLQNFNDMYREHVHNRLVPPSHAEEEQRDVANVVNFLISKDSRSVTGQVLRCDFGYS